MVKHITLLSLLLISFSKPYFLVMPQKIKIAFILSIFIVILFSIIFKSNFSKKNNFQSTLNFTDSINTLIYIYNLNNEDVRFNFSLNKHFYASLNDFIRKNVRSITDEEIVLDVFQAFVSSVVHEKLFDQWGALPLIRLNSLGYAICRNQSEIYSQICKNIGYKSRIIYLNEHVLSEIFYNQQWHLFDVDRKIFFRINNNVSSMNNLIKCTDSLIKKATFKKITHLTIYTKPYKNLFTNNYNKIKNIVSIQNDTFLITLPPNSSFIFPFPPDYKTDFYPYNTKAKLFLNKGYTGTIKNPLVLLDVEGNGKVYFNGKQYLLPQQRELLKLAIFNSKTFADKIKVEAINDSLGLVYALNPLFTKLKSRNVFQINASDSLDIKIIKKIQKNTTEINATHVEFFDHYLKQTQELMQVLDITNIYTIEQLYQELVKPYCISQHIDTNTIKKRLTLLKPIIQEPLNKFKNDVNFYVYLAILIYGHNTEFKDLFLKNFKYLKYKHSINRIYLLDSRAL